MNATPAILSERDLPYVERLGIPLAMTNEPAQQLLGSKICWTISNSTAFGHLLGLVLYSFHDLPQIRGDSGWDQFFERHVEMHLSVLWIDMNILPWYGFQCGSVVGKGNFHNTGYNISTRRIEHNTVQGTDCLTLLVFDGMPDKRILLGLLDSTLWIGNKT